MLANLLAFFLAASGCVHMNTATIRPTADVVQGWQQVPSDGLAHYLKIDEPFASFDSADYIWDSGGFTPEQIRFSDLPGDVDVSVTVQLRAYAWSDDPTASLGLAFDVDLISGGEPRGWDFSALPLNTWNPIDVELTDFPALHGGESILLLPVGTASPGGTIRLGQVELVVTYIEKRGNQGAGSSRAPSAAVSGGAASGSVASVAPAASSAGLAPSGAPAGAAPTAIPVSVVIVGDPATIAPMATVGSLNDLRATPATLAPVAVGAPLAPAAAGEPRDPEGAAS